MVFCEITPAFFFLPEGEGSSLGPEHAGQVLCDRA